MTPPGIERIAKGLTKAQREWLLTGKARGGGSTHSLCDRMGLSELLPTTGWKSERVLTPLGLSVRQYILEQEQKHG